jgi:hypothetical protein
VADCRILEALQEADETLAGPPVACADEACIDRVPAKPGGKPGKSR